MTMTGGEGAKAAWVELAVSRKDVLADIRDFFPNR
jgi:hypothetical protein